MLDIFEEVKNCKTVAISAHERPDGDAVGSCLGLYLYLKKRLPEAYIKLFLEKPGDCFSIIPGYDCIDSVMEDEREFDCFIVIDTSADRIGKAYKYFEKAKLTINIDHHISNKDGCGALNYVVPIASSASELVYNCLNKEYIDSDIASLLYMGIAHDTGVFRFSNTSAETLRISASLIEKGFDFSHLLDVTFYEKSFISNKIMGYVLENARLYYDGALVLGSVSGEIMEREGAAKDDLDGIVNQLMRTRNVKAGVFIYPKNEKTMKLSLRSSTDAVNVSVIAEKIGGGGHKRASGADYEGTGAEAEKTIVELFGEQLNV